MPWRVWTSSPPGGNCQRIVERLSADDYTVYDSGVTHRISQMNSDELLEFVGQHELDEHQGLEVLRNPYCSAGIAVLVADSRRLLQSQSIRENLSRFRDFPFSRAMDLLATLPWTSLLNVAQTPSAPPVVRRQAEKRLLNKLLQMTLGEKVALARKTHRPLLRNLIAGGDGEVLIALLDNPRLTEMDILVILNTAAAPPTFYFELAKHHKWGQYYRVRLALAECPRTPLPLAISALVQLRKADIEVICDRQDLREEVRNAARALKEKEDQGLRRVIRSDSNDIDGCTPDSSESVR